MPVPSSSETITVRTANTVSAFGRSTPIALNSDEHALGDAEAEEQPDHRGEQADHEALEPDRAQDLLARGAERPQRRELARALGDRDRQRVEDHERADEQRDAAEAEQEVADERHALVGLRGRLLGLLGAVLTSSVSRHERLHGADELGRRRAVLGGDRDRVELALALQQRLRGLDVPDRDAAEAERVDLAVRGDAGDLVGGASWPSVATFTRVADRVVLGLRGAGVDHDLPRARGPVAGLELERAEPRVRGVDADAEALLGDGLAVAADDVGRVDLGRRDRAGGRLDLRQRADLGEQRCGDRRRAAVEDSTISLPSMTASVSSYDAAKRPSKVFCIVSVRMNVPLTIETPMTTRTRSAVRGPCGPRVP